MRFVAPIVIFVLLLLAVPSQAQEYGQGVLNAMAYRKLPDGQALRVVPLDNSDRNLALQEEFERTLRENGFTISDSAQLTLTFETRDQIGAYKTRDRRAFVELSAKGGREGGENAKMLFNLYDSNTGGVFNEGKGETSIVTRSQFRMDVTIDDNSNGKRLWQAWAIANISQANNTAITKSMVPVLVKNLGSTVKRQTFSLY
ncbi:MAG TPA: hypothetical protein ENI69_08315 [Rhodospirillales bacterium]|nr:hypothetical protein [Rhodospirillales bacterium]